MNKSRSNLVRIVVLCLFCGSAAIGCSLFKPKTSAAPVAPTVNSASQPAAQVDLKQLQSAIVTTVQKTIQETVQNTVTQSFNDLGEKQLVLEKQRLHEQRQTWIVAGASLIGLVIVLLALPAPAMPMLWLIIALIIGIALMTAPWVLLMFLP